MSGSNNIFFNSYETHAQYACGRGAIEIIDGSYNITAVNLGRREGETVCPQDKWGMIREVTSGRDSLITSQTRYISLFRSEFIETVEMVDDDSLCFPVKAVNGNVAVVCF